MPSEARLFGLTSLRLGRGVCRKLPARTFEYPGAKRFDKILQYALLPERYYTKVWRHA